MEHRSTDRDANGLLIIAVRTACFALCAVDITQGATHRRAGELAGGDCMPAVPRGRQRGVGGGKEMAVAKTNQSHVASVVNIYSPWSNSDWWACARVGDWRQFNGHQRANVPRYLSAKSEIPPPPISWLAGDENFQPLRFGYSVISNQLSIDWRSAVGMCSVVRWPTRSTDSFTPQQLLWHALAFQATAPTGWCRRGARGQCPLLNGRRWD
jgi:hypothetical protein